MGVAGTVRRAFAEAQAYQKKRDAKSPPTTVGGLSPKHEALLPALEGKVPVIFSAHRADDIRTALRIADEFRLKPVIALGTEAWMLADELAKRKVPVIVHPTMQRPGAMEALNTLLANAAILKANAVPIATGTAFEGYVPKIRNLRSEAAMAAANGLGPDGALKAVTIDAAKLLGIDKEYGSIEVGKVADLVLYDGDPFEHTTHVTHTVMAGVVVYDRAEYLKTPFERRVLPLVAGDGGPGCCLGW
jgi:imidazolonepropionase-like amidohydrolase